MRTTAVQFPARDPSFAPTVAALENPIPIEVQYTGQGNWVLTVIANGDLVSGTDNIPIANIRWTATGAAYVSGTLSKNQGQTVATGTRAPNGASGTISFLLNNSWDHPVGVYSQTLTFTVVAF